MSRMLTHVELPDELRAKHGQHMVGRLVESLYGTRDASLNWEYAIRDVLVNMLQLIQGSSSLRMKVLIDPWIMTWDSHVYEDYM